MRSFFPIKLFILPPNRFTAIKLFKPCPKSKTEKRTPKRFTAIKLFKPCLKSQNEKRTPKRFASIKPPSNLHLCVRHGKR